MKLWLKEIPVLRKSDMFDQPMTDDRLRVDQLSDEDLPIWLAAQRAVARYEGILSSAGPRGRLIRKLLTWTGLIPSMPQQISNLHSDIIASEAYLRYSFSFPLLFWVYLWIIQHPFIQTQIKFLRLRKDINTITVYAGLFSCQGYHLLTYGSLLREDCVKIILGKCWRKLFQYVYHDQSFRYDRNDSFIFSLLAFSMLGDLQTDYCT